MTDMIDMSQFVEAKSDQLNADDLIGTPRTITVRRVTGSDGEQPVAIFYDGDNNKPFKPCKTMRRVLLAIWGKYASEYVGRSMTLYRDDAVTFGGLNVGGIRISHMSHMDKETVVVVMKTKGKKAGIKILPLKAPQTGGDDPATKWAKAYVGSVNAAEDRVALENFANSKATKLAELEGARPDLHKRCIEALDNRRSAFAPEGKPDSEPGEGFTDEPTDDGMFEDQPGF